MKLSSRHSVRPSHSLTPYLYPYPCPPLLVPPFLCRIKCFSLKLFANGFGKLGSSFFCICIYEIFMLSPLLSNRYPSKQKIKKKGWGKKIIMAAVDAFCVSVFGFLPSARHRWPPFLVKMCLPWQRDNNTANCFAGKSLLKLRRMPASRGTCLAIDGKSIDRNSFGPKNLRACHRELSITKGFTRNSDLKRSLDFSP